MHGIAPGKGACAASELPGGGGNAPVPDPPKVTVSNSIRAHVSERRDGDHRAAWRVGGDQGVLLGARGVEAVGLARGPVLDSS